MILSRLMALSAAIAVSACQTLPNAKAAKLSAMPDAAQMTDIKKAVKTAMGRSDLDLDPGRLVETSILIVRPVAVEGLTDRVPGTPTRFTLMRSAENCYLLEAGGEMRIDLPEGVRCI